MTETIGIFLQIIIFIFALLLLLGHRKFIKATEKELKDHQILLERHNTWFHNPMIKDMDIMTEDAIIQSIKNEINLPIPKNGPRRFSKDQSIIGKATGDYKLMPFCANAFMCSKCNRNDCTSVVNIKEDTETVAGKEQSCFKIEIKCSICEAVVEWSFWVDK